jgi:hypothetical protein
VSAGDVSFRPAEAQGRTEPVLAAVVASGSPELVDRTRHWHSQVDEIEGALGRASADRG